MLIVTKGIAMIFRMIKLLMIVCVVFMIVYFLFYCNFLSGCKPLRPLFNMSSSPGRLARHSSCEIVKEREYYVMNNYFCPTYYDYEDWGIVVLAVADITDRETEFKPYYINSTNSRSQFVNIQTIGKTVKCEYEKDVVIVCYNDESGNCYSIRLEMSDPRIACLFYHSNHKKRTEIIDLWYQLNEEKDKHTILFEAP